MASSSSGSKKNVAIGKRAKIDSAQKHMLIFVGSASVLLGVTVVAVIYFAKLISFNAKVISTKSDVAKTYEQTQTSLKEISKKIAGLSTNEYLESVARMRSNDCKNYQTGVGETVKLADLEMVRECSALRVITDALPYTQNMDSALTSFYILIILAKNGASIDHIAGSEFESGTLNDDYDISRLNINVEFNDKPASILSSLQSIEKSIRNFEVRRATISFSKEENDKDPTISLNAGFTAYNTGVVGLTNERITVCAKEDNEKCTAAGGDGSVIDLSTKEEDY